MAGAGFERLLVCLPARASVEALLEEAGRVAALMSARAVEVVTAPAHGLYGSRRELVGALLGRRADAIHVVAAPEHTVGFAASIAGPDSLIVTAAGDARRLPRDARAAQLVLPSTVQGRTVVCVADPERDTPVVVTTALAVATRLHLSRVVVCDLWFDESAAACDEWLARVQDERELRLAVFLARVPASEVPLDARVVLSPVPERTVSRIAADEDAALVVASEALPLDVPVLRLSEGVARRPRPRTGLAALWETFLQGPLPA